MWEQRNERQALDYELSATYTCARNRKGKEKDEGVSLSPWLMWGEVNIWVKAYPNEVEVQQILRGKHLDLKVHGLERVCEGIMWKALHKYLWPDLDQLHQMGGEKREHKKLSWMEVFSLPWERVKESCSAQAPTSPWAIPAVWDLCPCTIPQAAQLQAVCHLGLFLWPQRRLFN